MPIRQLTLIKFKPETPHAAIDEMGQGFASLTSIVPGLLRFEFGPDIGLENTTLDYALVIDFADADTWRAYREHPSHVAFAQRSMQIIAQVERVQYVVP
jgi:hypothetical protein